MKTCLIVDDSKIVRKVLHRIVEKFGFAILEAEHGGEVLDLLRTHPVDLILLDWNMPVMDGLECMEKIRDDPSIAQPKIIFCTTENEYARIAEAMAKGADEYVMKPFDAAIIEGKFRQLHLIADEAD